MGKTQQAYAGEEVIILVILIIIVVVVVVVKFLFTRDDEYLQVVLCLSVSVCLSVCLFVSVFRVCGRHSQCAMLSCWNRDGRRRCCYAEISHLV